MNCPRVRAGDLTVRFTNNPPTIHVETAAGAAVQRLTLSATEPGASFLLPKGPLLGLGEGCIQFDKKGSTDAGPGAPPVARPHARLPPAAARPPHVHRARGGSEGNDIGRLHRPAGGGGGAGVGREKQPFPLPTGCTSGARPDRARLVRPSASDRPPRGRDASRRRTSAAWRLRRARIARPVNRARPPVGRTGSAAG